MTGIQEDEAKDETLARTHPPYSAFGRVPRAGNLVLRCNIMSSPSFIRRGFAFVYNNMTKAKTRAPRRPVPWMTLLPAPLDFTTAGVLVAEADGATTVGTAIVVDKRVVEFWKVTLVLETAAEVEVDTGAEEEVEVEVVSGEEVEVEVEEMVLEDERAEEVEVDAKVET